MTTLRKKKTHRLQPGQALVEFALVISILFALVFSIISVWPFLNAQDAVAVAAANGAHEAAISGGNHQRVLDVVTTNLETSGIGLDPDRADISIKCEDSTCRRYSPITVHVRIPVDAWIKLPWLPEQMLVEASYTRANEIDGASQSLEEAPPIHHPGDDHPGIPGDN